MNDWDKKKNLIVDISMGITLAFVLYKCYSEPEHLLVCILNIINTLMADLRIKCLPTILLKKY